MDSDDVVQIQFDLLKNQAAATPSEIHDHHNSTTPHHHHDDELRDQHRHNQEPEKEDGQRSSENNPDVINIPNSKERKTSPSSTLEGLTSNELAENDDMDDENDGFKTPTSLEHRIPVPTQCPPAPKIPLGKRKESPSPSPSVTFVDITEEELQAMFWKPCIPNLHGKIKKAKPPPAPAEPGSADVANP